MRTVALSTTEIYQLEIYHTSAMVPRDHQTHSGEYSSKVTARTTCPYCHREFIRLGNHLPRCRERNGEDYSCYLSQKTLNKRRKTARKTCSQCGKSFLRLDTHLRNSTTCKISTFSSPMASLPSFKEAATPPSPPASVAGNVPPEAPPNHPSFNRQSCAPNEYQTSRPSTSTLSAPVPSQHLPFLKLPKTSEEWMLADQELSASVVPIVLSGGTVDEKHEALCEGIYQYFSQKYGTQQKPASKPRQRRRGHQKRLKKITQQKNEARRKMRQAKRDGLDESTIQTVAQEFHRLLRLHSKASKLSVKSRAKIEALTARRHCAKSFWRFAAQLLDEDEASAKPTFTACKAEEFFRNVYSCETREFVRPNWLPAQPPPSFTFNEDSISIEELQRVISQTKSSSTPSPRDQIPYVVLKRCPALSAALINLYNACWTSASVPTAWKKGVVRLIPKGSAEENPGNPSNFRPIALTSCIGKVFTTIVKNRWLAYMLQNNYMDTTIQKAFVHGIPGCSEHQFKLATAIQEAHKKHRSLTICWLDLANAYGSVHHQLIQFALKHYHAPSKLVNTVANLYTNLSATITTQGWTTGEIPLQVGVYQGDPLSTVIFNTVMCTMIEALRPCQQLGYTFSNSERTVHLLQYADDTCLIGSGPASCQELLRLVERWLQWTGMQAKPTKCHSLGIKASTGKPFDPALVIDGQPIPFIGKEAIKFLGKVIQVPLDTNNIKSQLLNKLSRMLERVDETPVTRQQKLRLYRAAICPRMSWDLAVNSLPLSWVTGTLEATATRFLKKWSGLAKAADTARLYLPQSQGGLSLPPISLLYKKQHISQACQLLVSADPAVRFTTTVEIKREEVLQRAIHRPMLAAREVLAEDPGMSRHALMARAKSAMAKEDAEKRMQHAKSLECQGQVFRCSEDAAASIWSIAVQNLPPELLKFSLNAVQDTLPHNVNLTRWRGGKDLSSACKLCGGRKTLLHVLNNCPKALKMRRYNERHDATLQVISDFLTENMQEGYQLLADLPQFQPYVFPPHISITDQRPDIVVWSNTTQEVWLIELSVCFETRYEDAHTLKTNRYADLMEQIANTSLDGTLVTLEVGCRGFLSLPGFHTVKQHLLECSKRKWEAFLINVAQTAIRGSHKIWVTRNWTDLQPPT